MAARLIGYGLSTLRDPRPAEAGALLAAGCHAVFLDITHRTTGPRPARDAAFRHVHPGDCIVIVRLSRFAAGLRNLHDLLHQLDDAQVGLRSLEEPIDTTAPDGDLVIRAVDATLQLQAAWITEVTTEGQTAARARGQRLGSPPKLTPEQADLARQMHAAGHPRPQHRRHAQGRNLNHLPPRTAAPGRCRGRRGLTAGTPPLASTGSSGRRDRRPQAEPLLGVPGMEPLYLGEAQLRR
ncbi:recombinase family protein [Streptomyces sp. NPDC001709]